VSGSGPKVVLYGRPGCHLCDDARVVLERVRSRVPFELIERDIEADDELLRRYLERIPVVAIDDREVFDYVVDERRFERLLEIARECL
jgi:glutaredoxin